MKKHKCLMNTSKNVLLFNYQGKTCQNYGSIPSHFSQNDNQENKLISYVTHCERKMHTPQVDMTICLTREHIIGKLPKSNKNRPIPPSGCMPLRLKDILALSWSFLQYLQRNQSINLYFHTWTEKEITAHTFNEIIIHKKIGFQSGAGKVHLSRYHHIK